MSCRTGTAGKRVSFKLTASFQFSEGFWTDSITRTSTGPLADSSFNPRSLMAVKIDGTGSVAVLGAGAGAGPAGPAGGPAPKGKGPPPPMSDWRPSRLNVSVKSNKPLRFVLSTTLRPNCCCSTPTKLSKGIAVARSVIPAGEAIICIAPRGAGPFGSNGVPRWPGAAAGGTGTAAAESHGIGGPAPVKGEGI